jgi:hypothetical protein
MADHSQDELEAAIASGKTTLIYSGGSSMALANHVQVAGYVTRRVAEEITDAHSVSDATYERIVARFGERGVAEATLIQGEYTMGSMFMNVACASVRAILARNVRVG